MSPRRSPIALVTLLMLAAFFAVRLPILLFEPDWGTTEMDQFGLFAAHLVQGLWGSWADYLPQPHQGCTFLFGAWCAPVMALGGPEIGTLRICSLTLHAAIAAVFTVLAGRFAGWKAAAAAGALFVFAPPMLTHYAQKGSTNHDDCDLFVGLALLLLISPSADGRSRKALLRSGGAGFLVGLAAAYMLDGGVRGAVVLGLALWVWTHGRLPRAAAMVAGGSAAVLGAIALGVSDGEDGVIRKALTRSTLWAEDRSGIETPAPLAERLAQLIDFALPTGFRVSGPDLWGVLPMSEGVLLYAYPAALVLLATLGFSRVRFGIHDRGLRLLALSCVAISVVQCVAVVAAGLEVEVDYIVPIWPYLVLLGAAGVVPRAGMKWLAARRLLGGIVLTGALLLCFEGMQWKLTAFYQGASDEESDTWAQSRFAGSLRAARPERHAFGPRLIDNGGSAGLRALLQRRPQEAPALLRLLGQATALELTERACGPERSPALAGLDSALPEDGRAIFWEGLGEGLAANAEPCRLLQGGPTTDWDAELTAALRHGMDDPEAAMAALSRGVALGRFDLLDGQFARGADGFAAGWPRTEMCVAAGHWAFITMRPVEMMEWLEPTRLCGDAAFAAGWGSAVAREVWPDHEPLPQPSYTWWWPDSGPDARASFLCAYGNERARVRAITLGEAHGPLPDCLIAMRRGPD